MNEKTILILGGGVGGVVVANELRRHLGREHRIVIVDQQRIQSLGLTYLWIMVGWRKAYAIERDLSLLEKKGIEFIHAAITTVDIERRRVETEKGTIEFDYLVIALGAEYGWDQIPGVDRFVNTFYTLSGSEDLYKQLSRFEGGKISLVVSSTPYKCPPAPYEAALLIDSHLKRRSVRSQTALDVYIPEPAPMQIAGPQAAAIMRSMLEQREIGLHTGHRITSFDPKSFTLSFESGTTIATDLAIFIPPHRSPAVVRDARLTNEAGWIPVDRHTLQTAHERVYAVGDVTMIRLSTGLSLPKAAVFAMNEAEVVAFNIAHEITDGKIGLLRQAPPKKSFDGSGYCFIEVGDGKAGYVTGEFFAEPSPKVTMHEPSARYHWGKVVFEKYWLWRWF